MAYAEENDLLFKNMHLRLTDDELSTLLEMMSLAMWVTSFNRKPSAHSPVMDCDRLLQRLFKKAKETELRKDIDWNEERQGHCFTRSYEESSFFSECYEEFRNESFWEELVMRLAERDLVKDIGKTAFTALSESDRRKLCEPREKYYWDELLTHGVKRLHLIHDSLEG